MQRLSTFSALVCLLLALAGCRSSGDFTGRVVVGPSSFAGPVFANDRRFQNEGIPGATVRVTLDPNRLNAVHKQPVTTDGNGVFSVPTPEAAGGLQTYRVQVAAQAAGYQPAIYVGDLPLPGQPFLIVLGQPDGPRGRAGAAPHHSDPNKRSLDDLVDEAEAIERAYR